VNRIHNHLNEVDMIAKLADLKHEQYHLSLTVNAMIELFVEKGILSRKELAAKAEQLNVLIEQHIAEL